MSLAYQNVEQLIAVKLYIHDTMQGKASSSETESIK